MSRRLLIDLNHTEIRKIIFWVMVLTVFVNVHKQCAGMIFFSYLTDFRYFPPIKIFRKLQDTVKTVQRKNLLKDGCRWFFLFSLIFSYFILTRLSLNVNRPHRVSSNRIYLNWALINIEEFYISFRSEPQAYAFTPDPRDIASFLTASGVPCWLDTKRIGFGMVCYFNHL